MDIQAEIETWERGRVVKEEIFNTSVLVVPEGEEGGLN